MTRAGWIRLAVVTVVVAALEIACRLRWIDPVSVIPPSRMIGGAWKLLASGEYAHDMLLTVQNVAMALAIAIVAGFAGGVLLHRMPRLRRAADPLLASYYAVPTFIFYPLFIVLLGLNRWPLVAIGVMFAMVAMALNTLNGFERVPAALHKTARVLGLSPWRETFLVTLPACAPYIFTGVKLAVVYAFIAVIAGEFVLAGAGFGFRIAFAYNNFDNPTMYGLMAILLLVVGLVNWGLTAWERRLHQRSARA